MNSGDRIRVRRHTDFYTYLQPRSCKAIGTAAADYETVTLVAAMIPWRSAADRGHGGDWRTDAIAAADFAGDAGDILGRQPFAFP